ncbi:MAG: gliding motility-associated C-terminal domain-containing protein [Flavobacteriales bacterium]|nr:gliding motility-associated C-terminal domain-containing protein [Flavobacteriales bacterium]
MKAILTSILLLIVQFSIGQNAIPGEFLSLCSSQEITLLNSTCDSIFWNPNPFMTDEELTDLNPQVFISESAVFTALLYESGDSWEEVFEIGIVTQPNLIISASSLEGCSPLSVNLSIENPQEEVVWALENGKHEVQGNSIIHIYENQGEYYPEVQFTFQGCSFFQMMESPIFVEEAPETSFEFVSTLLSPDYPTLSAENNTPDASSLIWTTNTGLFSEATDVSFRIESDNNIEVELCLEAFSSLGCSSTLCKRTDYRITTGVYMPQAFTPNYDGLNDGFGPVCFGISDLNYHLVIWNKWGDKVFESTDPSEKWDAINANNGSDAVSGNYFWVLQYQRESNSSITEESGHFVLLR